MTCIECGGEVVTKTLPVYRDDGLIGLPCVVLLDAAEESTCAACGTDNGISIPDAEGLEIAVAVARVCYPLKLNAQEIRFLRRALGSQAKDLADELEVRPETVSNWENGKDPINPHIEKILRLKVAKDLGPRAPAVPCELDTIHNLKIKHLHACDEHNQFIMAFKRVLVVERHHVEEEQIGWRPDATKVAACG